MPTLYIHAGVHRTATSSIQRFLRENETALLDRGYLYPFSAVRHGAQIRQIVSGKVSCASFAAELLAQIDRAGVPIHAVVLSDEDISLVRDPKIFSRLQDHFDVKIVFCVRRQDLWLESWYLQNVKWQWNPELSHLPFDVFLQHRESFFWIDYASHLAKYEAVFGSEAVRVAVFEKNAMPNGPIAAVLSLMGITDLTGFGPFMTVNSSLSPKMTEFVRHLPLDKIHDLDRAVFEKAFSVIDSQLNSNGSNLLLTHDQRLEIIFAYSEGNATLAQRYFGRSALFLEPVPHHDAPLANRSLPETPEELMALIVAPMVQYLGAHMQSTRRTYNKRAAKED